MNKASQEDLRYEPSNEVISSIHERRYEKIFECDLKENGFEKLPIARLRHDTTDITTIYFGAKSNQERFVRCKEGEEGKSGRFSCSR